MRWVMIGLSCVTGLVAVAAVIALWNPGSVPAPVTDVRTHVGGRVVDDASGRPIASARVATTKAAIDVFDWRHRRAMRTAPVSASGMFETELDPGAHWIVADAPGYSGGHVSISADGTTAQSVEIRLRRGTTVKGRVLGGNGAPIADANVTLEPALADDHKLQQPWMRWRAAHSAVTRADGTWSIADVMADSYILRVAHVRFAGFESAALAVGDTIEYVQSDIVLNPARSAIRGRVWLLNGLPDQRAVVEISLTGAPVSLHLSASTDAKGRFEFNDLSAGQYGITVVRRDGKPSMRSSSTRPAAFTLDEGEVKELDL